MPTLEQIRAARALLGWSQSDLADHAGLSQTGIARIENGTNRPNTQTLNKIGAAFDRADIDFIDESGVKKRTGEVRVLHGSQGLYEIMHDILTFAELQGGKISLFNARPANWLNWIDKEWFYNSYSKKLSELKDNIDMRIIAVEGETELISKGHAQNRFLPKEFFTNPDKSIYIYSTKIGFIDFSNNNIEILVLDNKDFASGVNVLFEIAWSSTSIKQD